LGPCAVLGRPVPTFNKGRSGIGAAGELASAASAGHRRGRRAGIGRIGGASAGPANWHRRHRRGIGAAGELASAADLASPRHRRQAGLRYLDSVMGSHTFGYDVGA
jgi:hypothetical protein